MIELRPEDANASVNTAQFCLEYRTEMAGSATLAFLRRAIRLPSLATLQDLARAPIEREFRRGPGLVDT